MPLSRSRLDPDRSSAQEQNRAMPSIRRCNVLGVGVSAINPSVALETIGKWIDYREYHYVCITGVHGVMESQRDPQLKHIHNRAGLVTPDGMPLVWISRLRGFRGVDRVYGPDLMLAISGLSAERGFRYFLYGGREGVAERLSARLRGQFPGLQVVGTYCPPFRPLTEEEDARVVEMINQSGADIVWVGLSTPKQERWMAAHLGKIEGPGDDRRRRGLRHPRRPLAAGPPLDAAISAWSGSSGSSSNPDGSGVVTWSTTRSSSRSSCCN